MARHNYVSLLGFVNTINIHDNEINPSMSYAMVYVSVARGLRSVGDGREFMKCDNVLVMTRTPEQINIMRSWKEFDIVEIKGMIAAKQIKKASFCTKCGERNSFDGTVVYIQPIALMKRDSRESSEECLEFLKENREFSNVVFLLGTLCRDPKKVTVKTGAGMTVTQYQIAINRKYHVREDAPEIKSDYPWVKSYGENAASDKAYLKVGSEVFVDGCIQARKVNRHSICLHCAQRYDWTDRALEIVPYETEYIANFLTKEEAEAKQAETARQAINSVLSKLNGYDDKFSEDDVNAGIESEEL